MELIGKSNRALALILPSVTLMAHASIFVVLEAVFWKSWGTSFVAMYNLVAAAASAIGLVGALQVLRLSCTSAFSHAHTARGY